jgi:hypothetical protein
MASSGAEIRINGRVIQHGLCSEIWEMALHPNQNRFIAQVDILCDQSAALPDTKSAKNGLREDDEKVAALFSWIRANIPEPVKEEGREAVLIAQRHPDTVRALLAELNSQKDKKGRPYHFSLTTWDEEGIVLPPDAA